MGITPQSGLTLPPPRLIQPLTSPVAGRAPRESTMADERGCRSRRDHALAPRTVQPVDVTSTDGSMGRRNRGNNKVDFKRAFGSYGGSPDARAPAAPDAGRSNLGTGE